MSPASPKIPCWPPRLPEIRRALARQWARGAWAVHDGPEALALVSALQARLQRAGGILCSSGTAALELALRAARVQSGREVIVAAYDYPGTRHTIEQLGGRPILVDLAPGRWTIAAERVRAADSEAVCAVVASHLHGHHFPAAELRQLADARGWVLIEDACQAIGGSVDGRPCGAWGHLAVLSFGAGKLLSAGSGGALLADDPLLLQRARTAASRGSAVMPLSELQASVLEPQLRRIDQWHAQRASAAVYLKSLLETHSASANAEVTVELDPGAAHYKLGLRMDSAARANAVIAYGRSLGLPIGPGFAVVRQMSAPHRRRISGGVAHAVSASKTTVLLDGRVLLASPDVLQWAAKTILDGAQQAKPPDPEADPR